LIRSVCIHAVWRLGEALKQLGASVDGVAELSAFAQHIKAEMLLRLTGSASES